jgi:pimeloyl-ACP methyl ester carboxylesterase
MVDGIEVFYREAGDPDVLTILLLHGFPSSSRMWEPLLIFNHTFDYLTEVIDGFTARLGLTRYVLFLQDYGGPIGFRLALAHPERVQALIVQNAVAHEDGLGPLWEARRRVWADRAAHEAALRENFLSPAATRLRHVGKSPRPEAYDPDLWTDELAFLERPGQADIQTDPVLRLPGERRELPRLAEVASQSPAAVAGDLGSLRSVLRGCGDRSVQARRARH